MLLLLCVRLVSAMEPREIRQETEMPRYGNLIRGTHCPRCSGQLFTSADPDVAWECLQCGHVHYLEVLLDPPLRTPVHIPQQQSYGLLVNGSVQIVGSYNVA